jgi:hypothetical protein
MTTWKDGAEAWIFGAAEVRQSPGRGNDGLALKARKVALARLPSLTKRNSQKKGIEARRKALT